MKLLNLGCGSTFHPDWVNFDLQSSSPEVTPCDLRKGIPLSENSADAVYHSHVLEHLDPQSAKKFLKEIFRVLKPNGVLRVVVPDLEKTVREYLKKLDEALAGNRKSAEQYQWILLELFDQTVRSQSGGAMKEFILNAPHPLKEYIGERLGVEANEILNARPAARTALQKLQSKSPKQVFDFARKKACKTLVRIVGGEALAQSFDEALFRNSGEIHRWMYDRFSLTQLLRECGFREIKPTDAFKSQIPDFSKYQLDTVNSQIRKPDSLFMECCK